MSSVAIVDCRHHAEYFGHEVGPLRVIHDTLRKDRIGWTTPVHIPCGGQLIGQQGMVEDTAAACNGYERILSPPRMKQMSHTGSTTSCRSAASAFCLNTAVEASSLNSRSLCSLLGQDSLIGECVTPHDTVVVSIGGNDLALNSTRNHRQSGSPLVLYSSNLHRQGGLHAQSTQTSTADASAVACQAASLEASAAGRQE